MSYFYTAFLKKFMHKSAPSAYFLIWDRNLLPRRWQRRYKIDVIPCMLTQKYLLQNREDRWNNAITSNAKDRLVWYVDVNIVCIDTLKLVMLPSIQMWPWDRMQCSAIAHIVPTVMKPSHTRTSTLTTVYLWSFNAHWPCWQRLYRVQLHRKTRVSLVSCSSASKKTTSSTGSDNWYIPSVLRNCDKLTANDSEAEYSEADAQKCQERDGCSKYVLSWKHDNTNKRPTVSISQKGPLVRILPHGVVSQTPRRSKSETSGRSGYQGHCGSISIGLSELRTSWVPYGRTRT